MAENVEKHDTLDSLIQVARQIVRAERDLAGQAMPVNVRPLPEIAPPAGAPAEMPRAGGAPGQAKPLRPAQAPAPLVATPGAPMASGAVDLSGPPLGREQRLAILDAMDRNEVRGCTKCGLCRSRTQTVFGEGDVEAQLMFIGEGPGADEDATGRPFVGRAGQKLDEMIAAMGLKREQVYIANVVKCRPPGNRPPLPDEGQVCWSYLRRQIETIRPKVIVVLGNAAAQMLLNTAIGITKIRGQWRKLGDIDVMPTFHPAYLLRQYTPDNRRRVWSDLQEVMKKLGLTKKTA